MAHLTLEQRYKIQTLREEGLSLKAIAEQVGKDKSVISRELLRNCDKRNGAYRADLAQRKYRERLEQKPKSLKFTEQIKETVTRFLQKKYSPEQIVGRCKLEGKSYVSHETIYQYVWADKRTKENSMSICVIEGVSIEGEELLTGREAELLKAATVDILTPIKDKLKTITVDNGKEFAEHLAITKELNVPIYFAHPYHSWERGANENMNGLIRQYLPKGSSFENLTEERVLYIQEELNNRPRKMLGYSTPKEYAFINFGIEI